MGTAIVIGALVLVGMLFLILEVFVVPGLGVGGVLGLAALIGAGVIAWEEYGVAAGMGIVAGSVILSLIVVVRGMRSKLVSGRFVLSDSLRGGGGTDRGTLDRLVGQEGVAMTNLRPAGIVVVGDKKVDAVSEGGYIEAKRSVIVRRIDGASAVVEEKQ